MIRNAKDLDKKDREVNSMKKKMEKLEDI